MKKTLVICAAIFLTCIIMSSCKARKGSCDAYHHPSQVMIKAAHSAARI